MFTHPELALITNKPRAASVYAVGPVTCAGETTYTSVSTVAL